LRELFTNLKSASTQSVRPTQDLAELTLFSAATEANFRRHSVSSPEAPRFSSSLDAPVFGPELPPPPPLRPSPTPIVSEKDIPEDDIEMVDRPSQDALSQDDAGSDTTLVDLDPPATKDAVFDNTLNMRDVSFSEPAENGTEVNGEKSEHLLVSTTTDKEATPSAPSHLAQNDNADSQGDEIMVNGATTTLQSEVRPSTPEKPPPVPPRNKPAPIQTSAESEESLRAQKLNFGAQQDVTEVIGNVMFRLQCAIKPTSIDPKFGEQIDKIRETFYGANAVYLKKAENYDVKIEDWANIIVFPSRDGPRTIYEALDVVFDEQVVEIDNALTTQHASISKLPPIFQTQIQRTDYDPQRQQATKNQNPILFEETIYLDRYMDSDKVMQRRKEAWKWKSRIRKLEARQKVLQDKQDGIDVPEALNATKLFLRKLEAEEIDGVSVNPSLSEAIEERRVEIVRELDAINEEISNLKKRLQDQFTDMREHRYSLQAVFIHRGTTNYGHYWIYIYDFERDIWREYNDERVSVVNDRKQIFEQRPNGPTPYYLVYVRDQDKNELVDAVCRKIEEEPETAPSAVAVNGSSALDLDEEPTSQHIEDVSLVEPARAHDLTDLAGMGSWDHSVPGDDDGRQW
jgi:ubiquitin carboxyl-terminal hydrolase 25/28